MKQAKNAVDQTTGSHSLAEAARRERYANEQAAS